MDIYAGFKRPVAIADWNNLEEKAPAHALVENVDLVIVRFGEDVSVLFGRCHHRGALLADGYIDGHNLMCGVHHWDYRFDSGVSEYNNEEALHKFGAAVHDDQLYVDADEIAAFHLKNPQPFDREAYLGDYADTHPEAPEPYTRYIQDLARNGLKKHGHHGPGAAMGVSRESLPKWEDLQFLPAQLSRKPLLDDAVVETEVVIGPGTRKPLVLKMPIFVTDMSFGALSREAKIALAKGADKAGTGICSGEGGMLADEQASNDRYFYEYASGRFGFSIEKVKRCQAFHFKGGQGAKTGTGGHLPGEKVTGEIAEVRGLNEGEAAISPATFSELVTVEDFRKFGEEIREATGGIPIGFKIAASRLEEDIDFALDAGADYIILDGRGGGTGSAPTILRDNINVPTIPALARARRHLDQRGAKDVSLMITGGLRTPADFAKALMLGADAVAVANSALQAIGCLGMRACDTNNCPVGIATQKDHLRARLEIVKSAHQLFNFLTASNKLIQVIARSCGYDNIYKFNPGDLTTFDREMHFLSGVSYAGFHSPN